MRFLDPSLEKAPSLSQILVGLQIMDLIFRFMQMYSVSPCHFLEHKPLRRNDMGPWIFGESSLVAFKLPLIDLGNLIPTNNSQELLEKLEGIYHCNLLYSATLGNDIVVNILKCQGCHLPHKVCFTFPLLNKRQQLSLLSPELMWTSDPGSLWQFRVAIWPTPAYVV